MKLLLVGDVMIGRLVNEVLRHEPPGYPWGDTRALLASGDCRICNLECVISDRGTPWRATPKAFHFRSDAKNIAVLTGGGIDAVSLANNHTLDFCEDALLEMLEILDRAGIRHAGAGADLAGASRPAMLEVRGVRAGVVAFTDNEREWEASDRRAGVFYVPIDPDDPRAKVLFETVHRVRREADLLIVSAHWGSNWGYRPPEEHRVFGRALIDAGADVIFGHSCHVVRGVEIHRGRPIIHSAGNFIDDYAVDEIERNDRSLIFVLETESGTPKRLLLYPTVIREFHAAMARDAEAEEIAATMCRLCRELGTRAAWQAKDGCLEIALEEGPGDGQCTSRAAD